LARLLSGGLKYSREGKLFTRGEKCHLPVEKRRGKKCERWYIQRKRTPVKPLGRKVGGPSVAERSGYGGRGGPGDL